MKRALILLLACTLLLGMAGCADAEVPENGFLVKLTLDTRAKIYVLGYHYELVSGATGSGGVMNAENAPMRRGNVLPFEFLPEDLGEAPDLSNFQLVFTVTDERGQDYPCTAVIWNPQIGKTYRLYLTGSFADGFRVQGV